MQSIMGKPVKKEVLFVELPADLKRRFMAIAKANGRKLVAEATIAIKRYVEEEEKHIPEEADDPID